MASSDDRPQSARTLPRPELNPLLNPLLADNMGRWAEVYFTSPPERREEAVLELVRELEAESPGHEAVRTAQEPAGFHEQELPSSAFEPETRMYVGHCDSCGHENPPTHQFCGMCGKPLTPIPVGEFKELNSGGSYDPQDSSRQVDDNDPVRNEPQAPRSDSYFEQAPLPSYEPQSNAYDLSLFQNFRERRDEDFEYEQTSSPPYRYYIGAVLAVVILVLGYIAWRSGQETQSSREASPIPAVTESANPPAQASASQPSNSKNETPPPSPSNGTAPTPSPSASTAPVPKAAERPSKAVPPVAASQAPNPSASEPGNAVPNSDRAVSSGNGAEELSMAQGYLSGSSRSRDSAEAAKWLWKSIAKHNGPASLVLADLYLKGDGVPKNCDQARVLLDSAARRGIAGAGDRLRHLQAFGCQ